MKLRGTELLELLRRQIYKSIPAEVGEFSNARGVTFTQLRAPEAREDFLTIIGVHPTQEPRFKTRQIVGKAT